MSGKYQRNKRKGSKCYHKMMSPKAAAKRREIYLYWKFRLAKEAYHKHKGREHERARDYRATYTEH